MPQARPIGRIKPRPAAEDWLAVGFDPWSAGKDPLSIEFIGSLAAKAEQVLEQAPQKIEESFIDVTDRQGMAAQEAEAAQQNKLSDDFEQVASWARHSRYRDIENAMNQPDWMLPIDYQDELGNTLLSIASAEWQQERIAKLCSKRGANVNLPNNTGQTVLHYAYAYGFEDLAEYLKSKGNRRRSRRRTPLAPTCGIRRGVVHGGDRRVSSTSSSAHYSLRERRRVFALYRLARKGALGGRGRLAASAESGGSHGLARRVLNSLRRGRMLRAQTRAARPGRGRPASVVTVAPGAGAGHHRPSLRLFGSMTGG